MLGPGPGQFFSGVDSSRNIHIWSCIRWKSPKMVRSSYGHYWPLRPLLSHSISHQPSADRAGSHQFLATPSVGHSIMGNLKVYSCHFTGIWILMQPLDSSAWFWPLLSSYVFFFFFFSFVPAQTPLLTFVFVLPHLLIDCNWLEFSCKTKEIM